MGARITAAIAALAVIALLAGAIGGGASASGGSITNVTEPNGGTVVLQGGEWNVYAPSNHSTGSNGSATPFTNNGDWVSIFGDTPQPSGSTHTSVPFGAGGVLIVCPPGSASAGSSGCHTNGSLGMNKTSTNDPDLAMVSFAGQQFPSFCWCQTSGYQTTVDGNTSSITVSAILQDSNGTSYKVNGSTGQQTVSLNAAGTDTPITVTGVANNGGTQDYTFTVHRGLSNADLSGLSISPGSISFDGSLSYSTRVPKATTAVTVTPTLSGSDASYQLEVGGDPVANPVPLNDTDPTEIDVVVTAGDATTTKTYSITVTKGLTDADLSNLAISPGSISFDGGTTSYSTSVPSTTTQVTVTPTLDDANATDQLKVGGDVVTNPITLSDTDPTNIDVVVTADDGTTTKTYSIAVSHLASIGLHATFTGNGKGTVASTSPDTNLSCSTASPKAASCTVAYDEGTTVDLQATAATGSYFTGWSGACSGSDTTTEFTMPSSTATCTASFVSLGAPQSGAAPKVTTGDDDPGSSDTTCYTGRCTLRDALASVANNGKITFASSVTTVCLEGGLTFDSGKTVTIDGGSGDGVTVCGVDAGARSLDVANGKLTIKNVGFTSNDDDGALAVEGGAALTLSNVDVFDNGAEAGGGIYVAGTLTYTGGAVVDNGSLVGGGLYVDASGSATLTNVNVDDNFAYGTGAGAYVAQFGTLTLTGGFVEEGESFDGTAGIYDAGVLTVANTVIGGNEFADAAAIDVDTSGTAAFTNATIVDNGVAAVAVSDPGAASFVNSTIAFNETGVSGGAGVKLLNTLLAQNGGNDCDTSAAPTSLGHNVADDGTCWSSETNGDQTVDDAGVGEPGDDGLVPLTFDSPALDAGTKTGAGGLTVPTKDARGTARPQGAGIDVGALEMQLHKLTVKTAGPGTGTVNPPTGSYVAGATIPLTASPTDGSAFIGWSGACSGADAETEIVLNADATCTATFAKPPAITSFSPTSSRIRSTVTINGSGFTGTTGVSFGDTPAASFKIVSDTKLTAVVPDNAPDSGAITVTNPADDASSASNWTLVWVTPKVTSFTPTKAGGGAPVTIMGSGFFGATGVDFNGDSVDSDAYTVVSDTKITTTVPFDATSGPVHVTTPGGVAASKTSFTFIQPPSISDWSGPDADHPHTAPVGATITITGANLTGVTAVKIDDLVAKFKYVNATTVTAVVPDQATNGTITLTTPGGTTLSPAIYTQSWLVPTITSVAPASGPIRTKVTITGTHFEGAGELSFGGQDATTWTIVSDTKITATVPDTAVTGVVQVTNPAGASTSTKTFKVTWPVPKITTFTPLNGFVGLTVTINGSGFLGATDVQFNGVSCVDFTVVSATQITATVPDGATTGKIKVITPGGTATSSKSFTVNPTP